MFLTWPVWSWSRLPGRPWVCQFCAGLGYLTPNLFPALGASGCAREMSDQCLHVGFHQSWFGWLHIHFINIYMECVDLILFRDLTLCPQGDHFPAQTHWYVVYDLWHFLLRMPMLVLFVENSSHPTEIGASIWIVASQRPYFNSLNQLLCSFRSLPSRILLLMSAVVYTSPPLKQGLACGK